MADTSPLIETFNTHRMSDEVVRRLASGREAELDAIVPAIRAAAVPTQPPQVPPALIVYGERGSGKSFLLRLVQLACQDLPGVVCVLLPEELYNVRAPHQLLQMVAASVRGQDWSGAGWRLDGSDNAQAWDSALADLGAALDQRFGPGQGLGVVLLENFDQLALRLFGGDGKPTSAAARARRQDEERLRRLLNTPGSRFMLVASATGTVDMDYERPLFLAFTPVDLRAWDADTAIVYFNKRRALAGQPELGPGEVARARAIIDFIGGNARLAQLLGTVLASPSAHTIADTLDQLVDKLADYYRERLDALPGAAAALLDELIRGGEPATQSGLAQRMGGLQSHIADAFSHLVRSRLVVASADRGGGAQWYRVRDRLFVHFYRRRYASSRGLAPIAELLERFYTPQEREDQIRSHLARGEFDDARAFGRLPLPQASAVPGYNDFRDAGVLHPPPTHWLAYEARSAQEQETLRLELRDAPDLAWRRWLRHAESLPPGMARVAARQLCATAASRSGRDQMALAETRQALDEALAGPDVDAQVLALRGQGQLLYYLLEDQPGAMVLFERCAERAEQAKDPRARRLACYVASFVAIRQARFADARQWLQRALAAPASTLSLTMQRALAWLQAQMDERDPALQSYTLLADQAAALGAREFAAEAALGLARLHEQEGRGPQATFEATRALALYRDLHDFHEAGPAACLLARLLAGQGRQDEALTTVQEAAEQGASVGLVALELECSMYGVWLLAQAGRTEDSHAAAGRVFQRASALGQATSAAEALYRRGWAAWRLGRFDAALSDAREGQARALAAQPPAHLEASWCARLAALVLMDQPADTAARAAAAVAGAGAWEQARLAQDAGALSDALDTWLEAATRTAAPAALQAYIDHLPTAPLHWFGSYVRSGHAVAAAVWAHRLGDLVQAVSALRPQGHQDDVSDVVLDATGKALADILQQKGRAAAYAAVVDLVDHLPALAGADPQDAVQSFGSGFNRLADELSQRCADPGLLRDVAALLLQRHGDPQAEAAGRLQAFADFHAAADPDAHLRRIDPDLATAITRIWRPAPPPSSAAAVAAPARKRAPRRRKSLPT